MAVTNCTIDSHPALILIDMAVPKSVVQDVAIDGADLWTVRRFLLLLHLRMEQKYLLLVALLLIIDDELLLDSWCQSASL